MPSRTPVYVAGIALAVPVVLPLLVFTYARRGPELAGIPFFYWYQFLLVLVSVVGTSIAFRMVRVDERRRREIEGPPVGRKDQEPRA
ncbi:DUF3311 domain-containing protein [Solicola sp. PLA-1-18]|uniref:DUF3311 domain-containing protein n=1 Tax=Solicola sp. PLA-1-18 TaxID=3380532 RepID=UPI003B8023D9